MIAWSQALQRALVSGTVASALSTLALTACGYLEIGRPAAPVNAISHWLWDREATRKNRASLRHTAVGYVIHHACSIFWATFYEKWLGSHRKGRRSAAVALRNGTGIAGLAWAVDYGLTPDRLKPGFEERLSSKSLLVVYAAFAIGLCVSSQVERRSRQLAPSLFSRGRHPSCMKAR